MFCFVWSYRYICSRVKASVLFQMTTPPPTPRPRKQIKVRHLSVNFDMCRDMWLIDITTFSFKKRDVCWFCMWMIAFFRAFYSRGHVNRTKFEIASEFPLTSTHSSNFGRHQRLDWLSRVNDWSFILYCAQYDARTYEKRRGRNPIPVAGEHWREYCAAKEQK